MKKIIGLLLLAVAFASCEGPMGPEGPAGADGTSVVEGWRYATFSVNSNDWQEIANVDGNPC